MGRDVYDTKLMKFLDGHQEDLINEFHVVEKSRYRDDSFMLKLELQYTDNLKKVNKFVAHAEEATRIKQLDRDMNHFVDEKIKKLDKISDNPV